MDESTVRIIAGILAVLCVVAVILRRKAKKSSAADAEF